MIKLFNRFTKLFVKSIYKETPIHTFLGKKTGYRNCVDIKEKPKINRNFNENYIFFCKEKRERQDYVRVKNL